MNRVHPILVCACAALLASKVAAQPSSAPSDADMPMADYLGLLEQIAPAAREGAQAYAQAFQQRCGRALTTAELRRATSAGSGDPVLMGMIRASQVRDAKAITELGQRVACGDRR
ncbi:hypothetical protein [Rhizobacter fulvus]|jgi:hypothetical protein